MAVGGQRAVQVVRADYGQVELDRSALRGVPRPLDVQLVLFGGRIDRSIEGGRERGSEEM